MNCKSSAFINNTFAGYRESPDADTLRTCVGGGGYDCNAYRAELLLYQPDGFVGALCADDHKGPNRQYVDQGKVIVMRIENE